RRYKTKMQEHHPREQLAPIEMNVNVLGYPELEEFDEEFDVERDESIATFRPHRIIKKESIPLKTLTYDEAILKMEFCDDPFLVFRNVEDQKIKVIYRRHQDGNYGVIETE